MDAPIMYDAIIIGSGPAGISAALKLKGLKVLLIDVGLAPPQPSLPAKHLFDLRDLGFPLHNALLGANYEGLENIHGTYISPKLKGPQMRYIWRQPFGAPPTHTNNFDAMISYAQGGLANAWGAGVMRYSDRDLKQFPISAKDLNPYWDELTAHIGISGLDDDLSNYFGSLQDLLPPLPLSPLCQSFYDRYHKRKTRIAKKHIFVGRLRTALIANEFRGRAAYNPLLHDFFQAHNPAIYNPVFTLRELINEKSIEYLSGFLVQKFAEVGSVVKVIAKEVSTGLDREFSARKVFLGAGNINTARIALSSFAEYGRKLPILDNPVAFVPFLDFSKIGQIFPRRTFPGAELVVISDRDSKIEPIQASVYGLTGPLRGDLIAELPLCLKSNIVAIKHLASSMGMLQIFFPDSPSDDNYITLDPSEKLFINHKPVHKDQYLAKDGLYSVRPFLRLLHEMLYFACSSLCKFPVAGSSIHYAGSLPMRANSPGPFETDKNGLLYGTKNIYIIDAANFPYLPSKNHTFTLMANAMRIADIAKNKI
jgi:choline dehydrogenase-like flavoprotein